MELIGEVVCMESITILNIFRNENQLHNLSNQFWQSARSARLIDNCVKDTIQLAVCILSPEESIRVLHIF